MESDIKHVMQTYLLNMAELACMECGHLTQEMKTIRVIPRVL